PWRPQTHRWGTAMRPPPSPRWWSAMPAADPVDLSGPPLRIHILGVGGAGMSAIATVLTALGHRVSGSDLKHSAGLERLKALGVEVFVGHSAEQVGDADVVAVSTAVPATNPEVGAAG